jgi:hypothetical protein
MSVSRLYASPVIAIGRVSLCMYVSVAQSTSRRNQIPQIPQRLVRSRCLFPPPNRANITASLTNISPPAHACKAMDQATANTNPGRGKRSRAGCMACRVTRVSQTAAHLPDPLAADPVRRSSATRFIPGVDAASTVKSTVNGPASHRARDGSGILDPSPAAMDAVSAGYVDVTFPWLTKADRYAGAVKGSTCESCRARGDPCRWTDTARRSESSASIPGMAQATAPPEALISEPRPAQQAPAPIPHTYTAVPDLSPSQRAAPYLYSTIANSMSVDGVDVRELVKLYFSTVHREYPSQLSSHIAVVL